MRRCFWIYLYQFGILNTLVYRFFNWYFFNVAAIFEICQFDSEDAIYQLANIDFRIQRKNTPNRYHKAFSSQNAGPI